MFTLTQQQLESFYFHFITYHFTRGVKFDRVVQECKDLELYIDEEVLKKVFDDAYNSPDLWL